MTIYEITKICSLNDSIIGYLKLEVEEPISKENLYKIATIALGECERKEFFEIEEI